MESRVDAEPIPTDRPALHDGRVVGFILDDVEPGSVAASLGFQPGDRVETVNEGTVVSLAEALDLVRSGLGRGHRARVYLLRDGRPTVLRYEATDAAELAEAIPRLDGARQVEKLAGPGPDMWRVWPSALAEPCLPGAEWPARKLMAPRSSAWSTRSSVWLEIPGPGQLFERLGFAEYQFIQRVNDTPVDGPDAYCAALLKAIDGAELSFEVSRRRKTFEHVYQLAWDDDLNASVLGRR
jgi:hypothetical protein